MPVAPAQRLYARLAADYDRRWARYVRATTSLALDHLPLRPGLRVVDVGCGTGVLLERVLDREPSATCVGIDVTPEMLAVAVQRLGRRATFVRGSATQLPLPDRSADVVVSTNALHYLADPARLVAEARRVLVPGGLLVVSDWCAEFMTMRTLGVVLRTLKQGHETVWTTTACVASFEGSGFTDVQARRDRLDWFWGLMTVRGRAPG